MDFKDLMKEYELTNIPYVGRCKLDLTNKNGHGVGTLVNHRWYEYSIESDNDFPFGYRNLIIIPHKVNEELRKNIGYVIKDGKGVTTEEVPLPHIDGNTGNIHSENFGYGPLKNVEICQMVCAGDGHSGPSIGNHLYEHLQYKNDFYEYKENWVYKCNSPEEINENKLKTFYVPKAAYYPIYKKENGQMIQDYDAAGSFEDESNKNLYKIMEIIWREISVEYAPQSAYNNGEREKDGCTDFKYAIR